MGSSSSSFTSPFVPSSSLAASSVSSSVDYPDHLVCSITFTLFRDPVFLAETGTTYERHALENFFRLSQRPRDPRTNADLQSTDYYVNWDKRREVQAYLDANPGHIPDSWPSRDLLPPTPQSRAVKRRRADILGFDLFM
eukprot:c41072_g1_i1.p1 GENE.c41072_g1_i1~~c41072_g1_i1.p1  ORF type:complete len:139 (+),score=18.06 c41072_g1_i1:2-418(+)